MAQLNSLSIVFNRFHKGKDWDRRTDRQTESR